MLYTKIMRLARATTLALSTAAVLLALAAGVALGQPQTQAVPVDCGDGPDCVGTRGSDLIEGSPERDVVLARAGADFVFLYQGGRDEARGNRGDDYVDVQDGKDNDRVNCGRGDEDVAVFDEGDGVERCEFTLGEGGELVPIE